MIFQNLKSSSSTLSRLKYPILEIFGLDRPLQEKIRLEVEKNLKQKSLPSQQTELIHDDEISLLG